MSAYGEHWAGHDAIDVRPNMRGDEVTDPGVWRPTRHVIHPIFPHICPTPGHQLSIRLGTEAELGAGEVNKHVAGGGHGTLGGQANTKQLFEAPVCVGGAAVGTSGFGVCVVGDTAGGDFNAGGGAVGNCDGDIHNCNNDCHNDNTAPA